MDDKVRKYGNLKILGWTDRQNDVKTRCHKILIKTDLIKKILFCLNKL